MSSRIKQVLDGILAKFESGDIPEAVAISTFAMDDMPSSNWSFLNRLIMCLSGTADTRGFRQWQQVGRSVKGGSKALYIMIPRMTSRETEKGDEEQIVSGFYAKPVFRYEDTAGKPLEDKTPKLPDLPLIEKAKEWGISVKAIPGNYSYYGYFSKAKAEIALATKEESVFFHELAHAAHSKVQTTGEKALWSKEIVAELCAATLCRTVGKTSKHLGNSYRYIKHYARKGKLKPQTTANRLLPRIICTGPWPCNSQICWYR